MTKPPQAPGWEKEFSKKFLTRNDCTGASKEHNEHCQGCIEIIVEEPDDVKQFISHLLTSLFTEIEEQVKGNKVKWMEVKNEEETIRKEAFIRIYNSKIDDLLEALSHLKKKWGVEI